jgi:hypothetical protein
MRLSQVNQGQWAQEWWERGTGEVRIRCERLRKQGYQVKASNGGSQSTTDYGVVSTTMIDIRPGRNADTSEIDSTMGLPDADPTENARVAAIVKNGGYR